MGSKSKVYLIFVVLAGLCWGTYIPFVAQGGKELKSSYASLLCVGVAYFLIAILLPVAILAARRPMPQWSAKGITFATLAGVAGAVGALCVIIATFEFKGPRIYVGPVIFALAPVINTLVSLFWHPDEGPLMLGLPRKHVHWSLYIGIVLAGVGAFLVLFAKEWTEAHHAQAANADVTISWWPGTGFSARQQTGSFIITVNGTQAEGKLNATEIVVHDQSNDLKYASTSEVPEPYRDKVKNLIDMSEQRWRNHIRDAGPMADGFATWTGKVDIGTAAVEADGRYLIFVLLAGLCWGTYVPLIAQGGKELKSSYASFLCVGVAYFLIAILFPLGMFAARGFPGFKPVGAALATLAGVAGAVGALCVIFATFEFKGPKIYVAPVIFALAPVINTLVSLFWHPTSEAPLTLGPPEALPHWSLYIGIVCAGAGAGLVLYAKELTESRHAPAKSSSGGPIPTTVTEPVKP